ncbi:DUF7523 family protein [Haloarchaeobius sp. DFWS5]|uniref:DUF7523 family protein n=1 Tax=Haloarchaeobius sp. DFWS5 TaxID=3446114 RepID=UPI003EB785E8
MTLAETTRDAADDHPFLVEALRAGVVNYSAAARFLTVDGDDEAVATALRRYAEALPAYEPTARDVRVTMQSGLDTVALDEAERYECDTAGALLCVGDVAVTATGGGKQTAILATGEVDTKLCARALGRLATADVAVEAAGFAGDALVVVVTRRDGANALRAVEQAAETVAGPGAVSA